MKHKVHLHCINCDFKSCSIRFWCSLCQNELYGSHWYLTQSQVWCSNIFSLDLLFPPKHRISTHIKVVVSQKKLIAFLQSYKCFDKLNNALRTKKCLFYCIKASFAHVMNVYIVCYKINLTISLFSLEEHFIYCDTMIPILYAFFLNGYPYFNYLLNKILRSIFSTSVWILFFDT